MEDTDKLQKNKDLWFASSVTEIFLGFKGTNTYKFENESVRMAVDNVCGQLGVVKTVAQLVTYTAFKSSLHLTSGADLPEGTFIMGCYGEIVLQINAKNNASDAKPDRVIKSQHGFSINGNKMSSLWIFLHESCNPNCVIKEGSLSSSSDNSSYICYVEAKNNVKAQDVLTVPFGTFSIIETDVIDMNNCQCGYAGCQSVPKTFSCAIPSCSRSSNPYKTEKGLSEHMQNVHGESGQSKMAKQDIGSYKCSFVNNEVVCGRSFKELKYLNKHYKRVHERKESQHCENCNHTFANIFNYNAHFKVNKHGCRPKGKDKVSESN